MDALKATGACRKNCMAVSLPVCTLFVSAMPAVQKKLKIFYRKGLSRSLRNWEAIAAMVHSKVGYAGYL
jgi:hypothetical protein